MEPLTSEEKSMICYFWQEKGDIERYAGWENLLPRIQKHHPELLKVWSDYKMSIKMVNLVIDSL